MSLESMLADAEHEQVMFCRDRATGLRSLIAVHDTTLGPAMGGVRMHPYESDAAALNDVLRLSRAMTHKAAIAGVNTGGGKSVIIGDPATEKTEGRLRAHGRFIQTLGGRYVPAIDLGTTQADLEIIGRETRVVSNTGLDPSVMTAIGTLEAIRAATRELGGSGDLTGIHVAIQGVGQVGAQLARRLAEEGARLTVTDVVEDKAAAVAAQVGAAIASPDQFVEIECDVSAPCAIGGVLTTEGVERLRCRAIAGGANNTLEDEVKTAVALLEAGIAFVPDYVSSAGGIIFLEETLLEHSIEQATNRVRGVGAIAARVFATASANATSTTEAAQHIVRQRLEERRLMGPAFIAHRRTDDW